MDGVTLLIGFLSSIFLAYLLLRPKKRPKNFPPGPPRIPIFGNALKHSPQAHHELIKLTQTYGPILGLQLGSYWMVILNDPADIREAMNRLEFSGRHGYNPFYEENVTDDTKGVVMSHGKIWQDTRRFSIKTLRDFGMGKRASIESIILEEVEDLMEELKKNYLNKPISTEGLFNPAVLNIIWAIVAGERFKMGDERMNVLLRTVFEVFATTFDGSKKFNFLWPWLANLSRKFPTIFNYKGLRESMADFMRETIKEHRATIQVGAPRDFIDSYLEEVIKNKDDPKSTFRADDDDTGLITTLTDLFGAGSETTSTTLTWTFFLLALYPKVQEKLYKEIESVAGSRIVSLEDRPNCPYSEAVMAETYRMSSLAAMTINHSTTEDVTFKGYNIPKDTIVFGCLYGTHHSNEIWGDPENFRPERFLSPDSDKTFVRNPNLMAFSVGKRACLGESLARDEHFLFMNNMVQQLKITMPPDEPKHSLLAIRRLVLSPEPHRLVLLDRNSA